MVIVTQPRWRELVITVIVPTVCACSVGVALQIAQQLGWLIDFGAHTVGMTAGYVVGGAVVVLVLLAHACLQVVWSYRPRYGCLGGALVSFGVFAPSFCFYYEWAPGFLAWGPTGYVWLLPAVMACSLILTGGVYGLRSWIRGRTVIFDDYDGRNCLNCGYDLTGNTSGRCPECGFAIMTEASFSANPEEAKRALLASCQ